MHPTVRAFCKRRPRVYGLLILVAGVGFGFIGPRVAVAGAAFLVLMLAAGLCAGGIFYLVLGSQAYNWNEKFQERIFPAAILSWQQTGTLVALGLGLLFIAGILYWLFR